jgi:hypothetical protein
MGIFTTTNESVDASQLELESLALIEAAFEGWSPAEGDLLTWVTKIVSRLGAQIFDQASTTEEAMFKRFGETIARVPPVQAAPASVESTWEVVDKSGYEIPDGTRVLIEASGARQAGFVTVGDTVIAPESTKATILLRAVEPGTENNGLSGPVTLSDSLSFVVEPGGIVLEGVTAGGVDEETEEAYLGRLVETLRLLSISLIEPEDFETDARAIPDIDRCKCIRAYNAETKEAEVPLCVSVFPIDANGKAVSSEAKTALKERQEAKLLSGVLWFVANAEYLKVDVKASVEVAAGFDPEVVIAAVKARLEEYFSPANWGKPTNGEGSGWINRTKVYRFELVSEIDRVGGVERVASVELAEHGKALGTADLTLKGVAPLTESGTFEVTAV